MIPKRRPAEQASYESRARLLASIVHKAEDLGQDIYLIHSTGHLYQYTVFIGDTQLPDMVHHSIVRAWQTEGWVELEKDPDHKTPGSTRVLMNLTFTGSDAVDASEQ